LNCPINSIFGKFSPKNPLKKSCEIWDNQIT
jgi:hypothetical protein